ncbi:MAG: NUDIX hydrolase [Rhizobiaceae bacterium]|nr:NUDIX hydrolase [Rhizobiaceae bacterium]
MVDNQLIPAVSAACVSGDRVLLVLRGRAPAEGLYAFPGGRVETGETLEAAMRRELKEETGLDAVQYRPFREVQLGATEPGPAVYVLTVFLVTETAGSLVAGDDAADAGWFSLDEAESLPITPSTLAVVRELLAPPG